MSSPPSMPSSIPMRRISTSLPGMLTVRHRVIALPCPRTHPYLTFLFFSHASPGTYRFSSNYHRRSPPSMATSKCHLTFSSHVQHHYLHPLSISYTYFLAKYWSVFLHSITRSHKLFPVYMLTAEASLLYITLRPTSLIPRIQTISDFSIMLLRYIYIAHH